MRINEISKRYAKALILFTEQNSQTAEVLSELILIQAALSKDKDVSRFFSNPTVSFEKKQNTLASFFETVNNITKTFILLLIEKNRFSNLEGIVQALQNYIDDKKCVTRGEIRYASTLTEKELESVEQILSKKL
ncbi:MAG: ATP synthase F1 subunit delta, partial [Pseudobdellovibrionaceae bacterium]